MWHNILSVYSNYIFMNLNAEDPGRNRPSDEGRNDDPLLRDDSAAQPGVNTMSSSDSDFEDDDLTETVSDTDDVVDDDDADLDLDDDLDESDDDDDDEI
jgi:hypothetical protein